MRCPYCDNKDLKVTDKRESDNGKAIRRRRECLRCSKRFTTYERIESSVLSVIKRDGRKEPYMREKLMSGIVKSFKKRLISMEQIEKIGNKIESQLKKYDEVKSSKIGELVLKELKKVDDVAYMRFASVYKNFEDIVSFKKEVELLKER